jgi:hypothetical protein
MTDDTELPRALHGQDGRFLPGRSGNPKGRQPGPSKQQKLLNRMLEEAGEVMDAVLAKAKEGDPASAGLVLSRILPTLRAQSQTVNFDLDPTLPLAAQVEQVLLAISSGKLAPDVGRQIIEAIGTLGNIRAVEDLESRLVILEAKAI